MLNLLQSHMIILLHLSEFVIWCLVLLLLLLMIMCSDIIVHLCQCNSARLLKKNLVMMKIASVQPF